MNLQETFEKVAILVSNNTVLYLHTEPEVLDFTTKDGGKIVVHGKNDRFVKIAIDPNNVMQIAGLLAAQVFNKEQMESVICWDIKSLVTYFKFYISKFLNITSSIIDLKVIEAFRGVNKNRPVNLVEAINRTSVLTRNPVWKPIYRNIHLPLMMRCLPIIETRGLIDREARKSVYPFYEIEGQNNGRMNCYKRYKHSFLPHNLSQEAKASLKPRGEDLVFMSADYRHCEVTVLQWLSKDETLLEILSSGEDLHKVIYKQITGKSCDNEKRRNDSKKIFLPVMYGQGKKGLAEALNINEEISGELIRRIRIKYSTAWDWMADQQQQANQGWLEDLFGRRREFDQPFKARNFSVQGVAATVCQEKMISLTKILGESACLVYSVHDGFGLVSYASRLRENYEKVRDSLQSESKICPGLSMKVEIKSGERLDDMKVLRD